MHQAQQEINLVEEEGITHQVHQVADQKLLHEVQKEVQKNK
jgi:hypothetical protein